MHYKTSKKLGFIWVAVHHNPSHIFVFELLLDTNRHHRFLVSCYYA